MHLRNNFQLVLKGFVFLVFVGCSSHNITPTKKVSPRPFPLKPNSSSNLLFAAVKKGNLTEVRQILDAHPKDVDVRSKIGETPLMWAADFGNKEIAELLIEKGADPKARSQNGWTSLHYAAQMRQTEVAKLLLKHGADVESRNSSGETPLFQAVLQGSWEIIHLLIENGATINATNNKGETPLHWACSTPHVEIVLFLIQQGARVNIPDKNGNTPLHWAASSSQEEVAKLLIAKRARVIVRNKDNLSPYALAGSYGNLSKVLLSMRGVPQDEADQKYEPTKWKMLQHHELDLDKPLPIGFCTLSVFNQTDQTVLVSCERMGGRGRFFVDPGEIVQFYLDNGSYRLYLVFENNPEEVYQSISTLDFRYGGDPIHPSSISGIRLVEQRVKINVATVKSSFRRIR